MLLALLIFDHFDALSATPCGGPNPTKNCYPWGGEGPVAGVWSYSSKEAYLRTSKWQIALLGLALAAPFVARSPYAGALAALVLFTISMGLSETLARMF